MDRNNTTEIGNERINMQKSSPFHEKPYVAHLMTLALPKSSKI
jgi:hypothetical protein